MPANVLVVWVFVSLFLSSAVAASADVIRPMDAAAEDALARGLAGSAAFRALVDGFAGARAVVHVVVGETRVFATTGATQFAASANGWTFLRIVLDERLRDDERTSVLAHELQHARELLDGHVRSPQDVRRLYERIGRPVASACDAFETAAAADTGARVWRELRDRAARSRVARAATKAAARSGRPRRRRRRGSRPRSSPRTARACGSARGRRAASSRVPTSRWRLA